jgi:hypothetical protein
MVNKIVLALFGFDLMTNKKCKKELFVVMFLDLN